MAANWSAGCAAEFVNMNHNAVVASKSGPVETGPTVLVTMALLHCNSIYTQLSGHMVATSFTLCTVNFFTYILPCMLQRCPSARVP